MFKKYRAAFKVAVTLLILPVLPILIVLCVCEEAWNRHAYRRARCSCILEFMALGLTEASANELMDEKEREWLAKMGRSHQ